MASKLQAFGIEDLDTIIGPSMPSGGVIDIIGEPGTGKSLLGLGFLSQGISMGQKGLYVKFTTTSLAPVLAGMSSDPLLAPLMDYDEPLVLDIKDERSLELLPPLMSSGEIRNVVLDHPDVMLLRGDTGWFKLLEETVSAAMEANVNVLVLEYKGGIGSYLSGGVMEIVRGSGGRRSIEIKKWDWDRSLKGMRIQESEVERWRI